MCATDTVAGLAGPRCAANITPLFDLRGKRPASAPPASAYAQTPLHCPAGRSAKRPRRASEPATPHGADAAPRHHRAWTSRGASSAPPHTPGPPAIQQWEWDHAMQDVHERFQRLNCQVRRPAASSHCAETPLCFGALRGAAPGPAPPNHRRACSVLENVHTHACKHTRQRRCAAR